MSYIHKHWNGELSLAISFWINLFLINVVIRLFDVWFTEATPFENPIVATQVTLIYIFISYVFIYPWQIIGLWRSANKYHTTKIFWPRVVKTLVVLSFLGTIVNLNVSWPVYKDLYQIGFGKDKYRDYKLELTNSGDLIYLKGGLGFGVAKEVKQLVHNNPHVKGIILNSIGGRIYEGRELSKIIRIYGLDTYTIEGCYSACVTAFISGNKRFLAKGANLGFHQYTSGIKSLNSVVNMTTEQNKDLEIYQRLGISQKFIDKIFQANNDDLWYPTIDEMLDAGVVHDLVNPSDLKQVQYSSFNKTDLGVALENISPFQALKKHDPKMYQQIIMSMEAQFKKGASIIEIQQEVGTYMQLVANKALPKTSDKALIIFARETINLLETLEKKEPILCMKNLFPEQYGSLEITKYLSNDELIPMMDALKFVIVDSYMPNNPKTDIVEAEELMERVFIQLGENANYLELQGLQNREEYSRSCKAVINFYELILSNKAQMAGNGLRYIFSP